MREITINHGIPVPRAACALKYPFRFMANGDSFFVESAKCPKEIWNFYACAKRIGIRVAVRKVPGGLRVWKIGKW